MARLATPARSHGEALLHPCLDAVQGAGIRYVAGARGDAQTLEERDSGGALGGKVVAATVAFEESGSVVRKGELVGRTVRRPAADVVGDAADPNAAPVDDGA